MSDNDINTTLRTAEFLRLVAAFEKLQDIAPDPQRAELLQRLRPVRDAVAYSADPEEIVAAIDSAFDVLRDIDAGSLGTTQALVLRLMAEPDAVAHVLARLDPDTGSQIPAPPDSFGQRLRQARQEKEMSLSQLAAAVHYSKSHLSKIENGQASPSAELVRALNDILGQQRVVAATGLHDKQTRVFISYAHEATLTGHSAAVRRLWEFLRSCGIDARLDVAAAQRRDWSLSMDDEIRRADYILVIASPTYRARAQGQTGSNNGRGVQWEAHLTRNAFYSDPQARDRFLPVVLPGQDDDCIPDFLAAATSTVYYVEDFTLDGAEPLLRLLTGQPAEPPSPKRHRDVHNWSASTVIQAGNITGGITVGDTTLSPDRPRIEP